MPDIITIYVPPSEHFTNRTKFFAPLLPPALRALSIMGIEWTTLDFVERAPVVLKAATFIISALMLAALEKRHWLDFKGRYLFPSIMVFLCILWIGISGWSYWEYEGHQTQESTATLPPVSSEDIEFRKSLGGFVFSRITPVYALWKQSVASALNDYKSTHPGDRDASLNFALGKLLSPTDKKFETIKREAEQHYKGTTSSQAQFDVLEFLESYSQSIDALQAIEQAADPQGVGMLPLGCRMWKENNEALSEFRRLKAYSVATVFLNIDDTRLLGLFPDRGGC